MNYKFVSIQKLIRFENLIEKKSFYVLQVFSVKLFRTQVTLK